MRTLTPTQFPYILSILFIWMLWLVVPGTGLASDLSSQGTDRLVDALSHETLGPGMLAFALGSAFLLGAGHALSPGHGKAMVAAYLVGSRGRKRDAVTLGLIVTFTHVASVLILGVLILVLTDRILTDRLVTWTAVLSGLLILGVGVFMLRRALRARAGHGHSHGHSHSHSHGPHDHGHSHGPPAGTKGRPGLASLLSLGVAGGMVPCPSAIVVLLVSVSLQKVALGLIIILVFSLGLAVVLVVVGIAVVSASGFASGFSRFDSLMKVLPLVSACLIMILGVILTGHAVTDAGWISF